MKRSALVRLHRYVGLTIAAFLMLAGLTGAVISWDRELDAWINRDLVAMTTPGQAQSPGALAAQIEAREPRGYVTFFPVDIPAGIPAQFSVRPHIDPQTGTPFQLGYTQVFVDPVTGTELARRDGDGTSFSRRALVPFLIRFHYSLQIPDMWGMADWGLWLTGTVALAWLLNLVIGLFVTLPSRRVRRHAEAGDMPPTVDGKSFWERWRPAWRVRWRAGSFPLTFDLHRAVGLWTMPLLLLISFTAFTQNLLAPWLPEPLAIEHEPSSPSADIINVDEAIRAARSEALRLGWAELPNEVSLDVEDRIYRVYFVRPGGDMGSADVGMKTVALDGSNGAVIKHQVRWAGSPGEIYVKIQFPLHSLRLFGLPGRVASTILGLLVALMTLTGFLVWMRKRNAHGQRRRGARKLAPEFAE